MSEAVYLPLLLGFAGGALSALLFYGILSLKLFRLHVALTDVKNALLSQRARVAATARWNKEEELAEFMQGQKATIQKPSERFANDPLPY